MLKNMDQRQKVIEEAKTWLKTPYHLNARLKGIGVDCGTFLMACFIGTGLILDADLGSFKSDFHLHRGEEVYLEWLSRYCQLVTTPLPGDIVVYKTGRIYSHGALIIDWPKIIHVDRIHGVLFGDAQEAQLINRPHLFWSYWRV